MPGPQGSSDSQEGTALGLAQRKFPALRKPLLEPGTGAGALGGSVPSPSPHPEAWCRGDDSLLTGQHQEARQDLESLSPTVIDGETEPKEGEGPVGGQVASWQQIQDHSLGWLIPCSRLFKYRSPSDPIICEPHRRLAELAEFTLLPPF